MLVPDSDWGVRLPSNNCQTWWKTINKKGLAPSPWVPTLLSWLFLITFVIFYFGVSLGQFDCHKKSHPLFLWSCPFPDYLDFFCGSTQLQSIFYMSIFYIWPSCLQNLIANKSISWTSKFKIFFIFETLQKSGLDLYTLHSLLDLS